MRNWWLLAPLMDVWKLLWLTGRMDVTNYVPFSPPSLLAKVMAKKRIWVPGDLVAVDAGWVPDRFR